MYVKYCVMAWSSIANHFIGCNLEVFFISSKSQLYRIKRQSNECTQQNRDDVLNRDCDHNMGGEWTHELIYKRISVKKVCHHPSLITRHDNQLICLIMLSGVLVIKLFPYD